MSPAHSFNATEFQIGDGTQLGRGTGDMRGFARDLYRRSDSPQQALTVYGEAELPTYYKLADEFCTCERWFAAHPGPTVRLAAHGPGSVESDETRRLLVEIRC